MAEKAAAFAHIGSSLLSADFEIVFLTYGAPRGPNKTIFDGPSPRPLWNQLPVHVREAVSLSELH